MDANSLDGSPKYFVDHESLASLYDLSDEDEDAIRVARNEEKYLLAPIHREFRARTSSFHNGSHFSPIARYGLPTQVSLALDQKAQRSTSGIRTENDYQNKLNPLAGVIQVSGHYGAADYC